MFLGWKAQHDKEVNSPQTNLWIKHVSCQISKKMEEGLKDCMTVVSSDLCTFERQLTKQKNKRTQNHLQEFD